ncbi:MAG TPA: hypothetical protein VFO36_14050, partial [Nitrospiraceae bacterium]|nr:hypothetical protein [Nitrospiraceae bacterium]
SGDDPHEGRSSDTQRNTALPTHSLNSLLLPSERTPVNNCIISERKGESHQPYRVVFDTRRDNDATRHMRRSFHRIATCASVGAQAA